MKAIKSPESIGFSSDRLEYVTDWMDRYVEEGKLAGSQTIIARGGKIAYSKSVGLADVENNLPWADDTLVRFYSMTKPITSVALMMLFEKGLFHLDDPVEDFIPAFKDMRVLRLGARNIDDTEPATTKMTVHHLLTHMSGLTYGFNEGTLGTHYTESKMDFGPRRGTLAEQVDKLAGMPLLFDPGTRWNYGVSTDVVGRLVEVISGQDLKSYFEEHIFGPLNMTDTAFDVSEDKVGRYSSAYGVSGDGSLKLMDAREKSIFLAGRTVCYSGGGGLISTAGDYFKFAEMLRRRGVLGDARLLGSRTVDFMTRNHLEGDLALNGQPLFSEVSFIGVGFGLGGWVMLEPTRSQMMGSVGDFGWGGMASTVFWVDPIEDLTIIYLTQLMPSSHYPLRKELRSLVYQALID
ncbi:serine hydrolase domain-containing protein [Sneathiella sp.]|uniref:serine hydrolase domain-containing protein n=1 Tax=Sneathiella sp. TaxID=1964365 RepID=UPI003565A454